MERPVKTLNQPLWQQGLVLFISTIIVFKIEVCLANGDIISNGNYEYLLSLYNDEEEARRVQLKNLQLTNERLIIKIRTDYEKHQAEAKDDQATILTESTGHFYCYAGDDGYTCVRKK